MSSPVIRKPEITKKTVTPRCAKVFPTASYCAKSGNPSVPRRCPSSTAHTETARRPSSERIRPAVSEFTLKAPKTRRDEKHVTSNAGEIGGRLHDRFKPAT